MAIAMTRDIVFTVKEGSPAMRRLKPDAFISAAALVTLLVALIAIDPRVRERAAVAARGAASPAAVGDVGGRLGETASLVVTVARDQGMEHAPLVVFVGIAAVLVVFMLRV